jgi:hypothetical protein
MRKRRCLIEAGISSGRGMLWIRRVIRGRSYLKAQTSNLQLSISIPLACRVRRSFAGGSTESVSGIGRQGKEQPPLTEGLHLVGWFG